MVIFSDLSIKNVRAHYEYPRRPTNSFGQFVAEKAGAAEESGEYFLSVMSSQQVFRLYLVITNVYAVTFITCGT